MQLHPELPAAARDDTGSQESLVVLSFAGKIRAADRAVTAVADILHGSTWIILGLQVVACVLRGSACIMLGLQVVACVLRGSACIMMRL